MTRKEFIKVLDEKDYSYKIVEGDKIVVTHYGHLRLESLTSIPLGVEFKNGGSVDLGSLKSLPPGVEFKNGGNVDLRSLKILPPGVVFKNKKDVWFRSIEKLPTNVEFKNGRNVYLESLIGGEGWFHKWPGNIEGIDPKTLLNKMIQRGIFSR